MGKKLFIGNLPYEANDQDLMEIFTQVGEVTSAKVIMDKFTGRSKGFGFVEMSSGTEAQSAIQTLNGSEYEGRSLTVNEARPQERRPSFGGDRDRREAMGGRRRW